MALTGLEELHADCGNLRNRHEPCRAKRNRGENMRAMLLGAGEGTRLRPITATRPKPMIPIANRPIMEHILLLLKEHGITEVYSNLYYLADQIESYFGDGSAWGMSVKFKVEEKLPGTAGGLKNAEAFFRDTFLVISGDLLTDFNLTEAIEFHKRQGSMATLLLTKVENPLEYGVVITDQDGRVLRFLEKPGWSEAFSDTVNSGIFILEPDVLDYIPDGVEFDFSKDLFPLLLRDGKPLFGFVANGYWCDVGNIDSYIKAQVDALSGKVKLNVPGEQVMPGVWVGRSAKISSRADLKGPMVLGENCEIAPGARIREYSVIGDNVILAPNSFVVRSTVFSNSYIGEGSVVSGSIICKNVVLKESVRVGEGAVVSDDSILNSSVAVKPGVRVWPGKSIDEGVVLSSSVVWEQRFRREVFSGGTISGLVNFEFTPEFAVRLGSAIGATMKKGASVVVSRDPSSTARMMKRALVAGLSSAGVHVCDLQGQPMPILWHMLKRDSYISGIHTSMSESSTERIDIQVLDGNGLPLSRDDERKVETLLSREDPRRASASEVGGISYFPRAVDYYVEDCMDRINVEAAKSHRVKAVVDCGYGFVGGVLPSILVKMGVEVTSLNAIEQPSKMPKNDAELERAKGELGSIVRTVGADLGILIEPQGTHMHVADETGRVLSDLELAYLYALLLVRAKGRGSRGVTVPSFMPKMLIDALTANGATVYRSKVQARSLVDLARTSKSLVCCDLHGGFLFPELHNGLDAMFGAAKFTELVAVESAPLSQLAQLVPEHNLVADVMPCPWEMKAQVMRELLGKLDDPAVDTFDGYRRNIDDSHWYMVLPDAARPVFRLYAEGGSRAQAEAMLARARDEVAEAIEG